MKGGEIIVNCGFTGTGKTKMVKDLIRNVKNPVIFDVNNEYGRPQYYGKTLPKIGDWLDYVNSKVRNSVVVIDEATIFFKMASSGQNLMEMMVRKRHTGNTYLLNFHFLSSVPNHIISFTNHFILFRTGERSDLVQKKYEEFPAIWDAYCDLRELNVDAPSGYKCKFCGKNHKENFHEHRYLKLM